MKRMNRPFAVAALLAVLAIGTTILAGAIGRGDAHADSSPGVSNLFCSLGGTWVGNAAAGNPGATPLTYTEQFSPIDLRTLNYRIEFKNVDATWAHPLLSATDTWIGMEGVARLGGRGTSDDGKPILRYDVTAIGYGIKEVENARGQIQHITTMTGTMWVEDCETKNAETVLRVYDYTADEDGDGVPDVDKNLDGIPDEDATPVITAPPAGAPVDFIPFPASKRVRLGLPN
jgi:hypothetical protein